MSHYTCIDATTIRPRMIVEIDEGGRVNGLWSFDDMLHEPAATVFTDGVISGELLAPVSMHPDADAFSAIAACTRPIRVGERNKLLVWKALDLAARKFTPQSHFCDLCARLLNSAQTIAVAAETFSDSEVRAPGG